MKANTTPPPALRQMLTSFFISQALYVAAELGIADLLKDGAKSSDELARSAGADSRSLYRLLRCLASVGVFDEVEPKHFGLTPLGASLQTDAPGSLRAYARYLGGDWYWRAWGNLLYSVRTGGPAFDHVFGTEMFEYLAQHPEASRRYSEAMGSRSAEDNAEITAACDFSSMRRIVDVGAGRGSLLVSILKANPGLAGILFDRPSVVEAAKPFIEARELLSRCELVGGDFFEAVPSGGDAYILQKVLHDWGNDQAVTILKSCHRAMPPHGKLLVCEMVIPPGNEPFVGKVQDLTMLILHPGGGERTAAEFRALFDAAGFTLSRIIPTKTSISVIEGVRT
jgi:hypothetical protein